MPWLLRPVIFDISFFLIFATKARYLRKGLGFKEEPEHEVAHAISFPGLDDRKVSSDGLLEDVCPPVDYSLLLRFAHLIGSTSRPEFHRQSSLLYHGTHSCGREETGNTCILTTRIYSIYSRFRSILQFALINMGFHEVVVPSVVRNCNSLMQFTQ